MMMKHLHFVAALLLSNLEFGYAGSGGSYSSVEPYQEIDFSTYTSDEGAPFTLHGGVQILTDEGDTFSSLRITSPTTYARIPVDVR